MIGIRAVIMTLPLTILLVLSATESDCDAGAPVPATQNVGGGILYNGIQLPPAWPPRRALKREPMPVPYLAAPPAVVPIDVGRQLFVDDFLIEKSTLRRAFHSPDYFSANPVLAPDKPWETVDENPTAMAYSDGVWFDPKDHLFKMWYMGGNFASTCYATSRDGIHWEKPILDVEPGTNIVHKGSRDSCTVWLDQADKDPARRFKMFWVTKKFHMEFYVSADGIHWGEPLASSRQLGDRSTAFFNPFRNVWVISARHGTGDVGRCRSYWENADALEAIKTFNMTAAPLWVGADNLDPMRDDLKTRCELYNLDAAPYESLMVGYFAIYRGLPKDRAKPTEVLIGFSRDGFHWDRSNRTPFFPVSEHQGDWNWCNVQSCGGGCLIVGDQLFFYCSGRAGLPGTNHSGRSATGLATMRRDGFASMDTPGGNSASEGELTTRPVRFSGKYLFVNADASGGELRAQLLDENGKTISPFTFDNCIPASGDHTKMAVKWKDAPDVSRFAGRPVRFQFRLTSVSRAASLYAFWVSPDATGASHGYVGAGGPGFEAAMDTVVK